jgi:hypothetical protein
MSDPTIRRPREEEQRKWREQRRLEEEAEQRRAANVSRNEQGGRDSQRLTALEREWRTFKAAAIEAQHEQQRRALARYVRNRHRGPSSMGCEDEVEQSLRRPCRQTDGRSK